MCPLFIFLISGLMTGFVIQNPAFETQAIARVQQMPVSQFDPALPERPFIQWVKQLAGPDAGITWQITDCAEQRSPADVREVQACVEMTALLPDDRKIVVMTLVGNFKQGIVGRPRLSFAVVEYKGQFYDIEKLRDLPEVLRNPVKRNLVKREPVKSQDENIQPAQAKIQAVPVSLPGLMRPPLLVAVKKSPPSVDDDGRILRIPGVFYNDTALAPRSGTRRVSEGVLKGNVINKALPVYPSIAKQLRLGGEVKVEVVIAEDGRVIEAKAISGHDLLRSSAEDAARKWIFKPTLLNNAPVRTQGELTFVFTRP